jgi:hypothetical protein
MTKTTKIAWNRIAVEAVAIVGSILLAFSIDAWWDATLERERERELFGALSDDFRRTKLNLIDGLNFHTAVKASSNRLLEVATSGDKDISESEFDRLLLDISWWDFKHPFTTGALNSALAAGEFAIIRSDELRRLMADWPTTIAIVEIGRRQDYDFFFHTWTPYLREKGLFLQAAAVDAPAPGRPQFQNTPPNITARNRKPMSSIIEDEVLHSILMQKIWIQSDNILQFQNAIIGLDEIVDLLDAELGDRH